MKKVALLIAVIMSLLAFSVVFASEAEDENVLLIAPAPEATEEGSDGETMVITSENDGEVAPEESNDETIGELETVPEDENVENTPVTTNENTTNNDNSSTNKKSNSTIVGAIIAIVIVVVVIALAALIQKK